MKKCPFCAEVIQNESVKCIVIATSLISLWLKMGSSDGKDSRINKSGLENRKIGDATVRVAILTPISNSKVCICR